MHFWQLPVIKNHNRLKLTSFQPMCYNLSSALRSESLLRTCGTFINSIQPFTNYNTFFTIILSMLGVLSLFLYMRFENHNVLCRVINILESRLLSHYFMAYRLVYQYYNS